MFPGQRRSDLCKEPPPLPVPEFEVGSTVPLDHLHGGELLLPLGKSPTENKNSETNTHCVDKEKKNTRFLQKQPVIKGVKHHHKQP